MDLIQPITFPKSDIDLMKIMFRYELKILRENRKLTQRDIANLSGLSIQCISDIENKTGNPTLNSIAKYLNCLGYEITTRRKMI